MANEFYVTIQGVKSGRFHGESTKTSHKDKITGLEFFYEVAVPRDATTGLPTGRRQHLPIRFIKEWGAASPQIFQALVNNETLTSVLFEFVQAAPDGKEETFQTIKLTGAAITAFRQNIGNVENFVYDSTPDVRRLEMVQLSFRTIEIDNLLARTSAVDDPFTVT